MRVFIIAGNGSSGKNTVAGMIKDFYDKRGEKTIITGIAKYIKMYATEVSNWKGNEDNKPRTLLQNIGSKIRNEIDEDFFVARIVADMKFYEMYFDNAVISDARLPFEIEHIRQMCDDTFAIQVIRPNYENNLTEEQRKHETEDAFTHYDRFDFEIINDSDLETLEQKIKEILERIDEL